MDLIIICLRHLGFSLYLGGHHFNSKSPLPLFICVSPVCKLFLVNFVLLFQLRRFSEETLLDFLILLFLSLAWKLQHLTVFYLQLCQSLSKINPISWRLGLGSPGRPRSSPILRLRKPKGLFMHITAGDSVGFNHSLGSCWNKSINHYKWQTRNFAKGKEKRART